MNLVTVLWPYTGFILSSPISPHTVKYTNSSNAKNMRDQFQPWVLLLTTGFIFHCSNFSSVVKQAYPYNTIHCLNLSLVLWLQLQQCVCSCCDNLAVDQRFIFKEGVSCVFRVLFIYCCWENSLYHHHEIMTCYDSICNLTVKCIAFTVSLWWCKLVPIAWNALLKLVVHSSPFLEVAGTKICCIVLSVCMYDPWIHSPFLFYFPPFFFFWEVVI